MVLPTLNNHQGFQQPRRRRRKPQQQPWFNWLSVVTCVVTMQVIGLICFLIRSDWVSGSSPTRTSQMIEEQQDNSPLEWLAWMDTTLHTNLIGNRDHEELSELEAHLIQRTEDRLDHGSMILGEDGLHPTGLDDFYSRHQQRILSSPDISRQPVLIVGGLEGSGMSTVVDTLGKDLGIPMVTMAVLSGGSSGALQETADQTWNNMVQMVLEAGIQTPNYEFSSLPEETKKGLRTQGDILMKEIAKQVPFLRKTVASASTILPPSNDRGAHGFYAPDAWFLLPVLQQIFGSIQFLHVVRDGRDVVMLENSTNLRSQAEQYTLNHLHLDSATTTNNDHDKAIISTMKLWNDWNQDMHQWQRQHSGIINSGFEFLTIRMEDWLSPEHKLESLIQVADFLQGTTDDNNHDLVDSLCCISRRALTQQSPAFLKSFAKAQEMAKRADEQDPDQLLEKRLEKDERRNARLGDLLGHNRDGETAKILEHRHERFQEIGARLAELSQRHGRERRRLLEGETHRLQPHKSNGSFPPQNRRLGESPEAVEEFLVDYRAWRKTFVKAHYDENAARSSIAKGEQLLKQFRQRYEERLIGTLTEHSFTRSIQWLRTIHGSSFTGDVHSQPRRYGKWVQLLEDKPDLSKQLHQVGHDALGTLGYEPMTRFIDQDPHHRKDLCTSRVIC